MDGFAHAEAFLREHDRDRYLASLVLTGPHRAGIVALHAFNADLAMVRERVSDPALGDIRLQWWADALEGGGHGGVRDNPLAAALLDTVARYAIPAGTLQRLIAARRFDLFDDPMPDMQSFEGYAGETGSTLFQLAAMIRNDGEPVETGDAAGHLGVAQALAGHLRAFGFNAAMGRLFLPLSILAANGVRETEIFSGTESEGLIEARAQLIDIAADHLARARAAIAALPARLRPAFAMTPLVAAQIDALRRHDPVFRPPPERPDWRKIAMIGWWTWRNR